MSRPESTPRSDAHDIDFGRKDISVSDVLSAGHLPKTPETPASLTSELSNSPRRAYTYGAPLAYRAFRNHTMDHLRRHIPLEQLLDARWGECACSQDAVMIGRHTITNNRTLADVFSAFLEKRRQLAAVIPALDTHGAFLFPAFDGGPLFVSHRPLGMTRDGLSEFVSSRDRLFTFMYKTIRDKDLAYFAEMNVHELVATRKRLKDQSSLHAQMEELADTYLVARERWIGNLTTLADALRDHRGKGLLSRLIKALEDCGDPSADDQIRLAELRELKMSADREVQRQYEIRAQGNRARSARFRVEADQDASTADEEEVSANVWSVFSPNQKLVFLGTDGGALFGDTGQTCYNHSKKS